VSDTTDTNDIKGIVADRPQIPRAANIVGVDGDGDVHIHSPREDRVWVLDVDPDSPAASVITHIQDVPDIWAWIDHTEQCRGAWRELRYHRGSWAQALVETLTEAVDE